MKKTQKSGNNSEKETDTNKRPGGLMCDSVALGKKVEQWGNYGKETTNKNTKIRTGSGVI